MIQIRIEIFIILSFNPCPVQKESYIQIRQHSIGLLSRIILVLSSKFNFWRTIQIYFISPRILDAIIDNRVQIAEIDYHLARQICIGQLWSFQLGLSAASAVPASSSQSSSSFSLVIDMQATPSRKRSCGNAILITIKLN